MKKITYNVIAPVVARFCRQPPLGVPHLSHRALPSTGPQYVDKLGQPVTAEEYFYFELWQGALFVTVIPVAGLAIAGVFWHHCRNDSLSTKMAPRQTDHSINSRIVGVSSFCYAAGGTYS